MKQLQFDTGLVAYDLNRAAQVAFNPTDSAFVERLFHTFDALDQRQDAYWAEVEKAAGSREVFDIARKRDGEMRAMIDEALGQPVCAALFDPELDGQDRVAVLLEVLYPELAEIPPEHYGQAVQQGLWFLNGGTEEPTRRMPRLVDWGQDFPYIVAPINRVTGQEIRTLNYMHWWTFLAAYYEIGDCTFAQIVRIRDRLARGKPLDKTDREWYSQNRHLVDFQRTYTEREEAAFASWLK